MIHPPSFQWFEQKKRKERRDDFWNPREWLQHSVVLGNGCAHFPALTAVISHTHPAVLHSLLALPGQCSNPHPYPHSSGPVLYPLLHNSFLQPAGRSVVFVVFLLSFLPLPCHRKSTGSLEQRVLLVCRSVWSEMRTEMTKAGRREGREREGARTLEKPLEGRQGGALDEDRDEERRRCNTVTFSIDCRSHWLLG